MASPLVSVIIPTYNRSHCIEKAVDSALQQSYPNIEVIVVDDGSTDDTQDKLRAKYGARIRSLVQRNNGPGAARNTGIRAALGEWLAFLDSDDEWDRDKLRLQVQDVLSDANIVAHSTNVRLVTGGTETNLFALQGAPTLGRRERVFLRPLIPVLTHQFFPQSTLAKKSAIESVGLFPEGTMYEDIHLLSRLATQGAWCICNDALVSVYRRDEDPTLNVTFRWRSDQLRSLTDMVSVWSQFLDHPALSAAEQHFIRHGLQGYLFELAAFQVSQGRRDAACDAAGKAYRAHPSWKTFLKRQMITFSPWLLRSWLHIRHRNDYVR